MAISEDTAALVAAQLTAAVVTGQKLGPEQILKVYEDFKAEVGKRPAGGGGTGKLGGV